MIIGVGLLFWLLGVQLGRGKWLVLVAGFKRVGKKADFQIEPDFAARVVGEMFLVSCLVVAALLIFPEAQTTCLLVELFLVVCTVAYISLNKRHRVHV